MRAGYPLLALCIAITFSWGCRKKRPSYDRSTPEKTLVSLEKAFEKGRIPADIEAFFVSQRDISGWRLRCKNGKCKKAAFKVLEKKSEDEYAASYMVEVNVYGTSRSERIMVSKSAPIKFVFEDGAWFIEELGSYTRIPLKSRKLGAQPKESVDGGR
jgi:hypothetical protein